MIRGRMGHKDVQEPQHDIPILLFTFARIIIKASNQNYGLCALNCWIALT